MSRELFSATFDADAAAKAPQSTVFRRLWIPLNTINLTVLHKELGVTAAVPHG